MAATAPVTKEVLLSTGLLRPAYQPIVEIETGLTVGYEALARWPELRVTPEEVFAQAATGGWIELLDWTCRVAALRGALVARLGRRQALFVNAEPSSFGGDPPDGFEPLETRAGRELRLVVEITERSLAASPAKLLRACRDIRGRGMALALDDVGAVPESLALLPLVAPDVVKIDLGPTRTLSPRDQAHFMTAVAAYAERTGALILAEGIETEQHVAQAQVLGATLGQGWYYGAAGPLPEAGPAGWLAPFARQVVVPAATPTALLEGSGRARVAAKEHLVAMSILLEHQAMSLGSPAVVLAAVQDGGRFSATTSFRYAELARRCPLVVVFGAPPGDGGAGYRTVPLESDDPLRDEWVVLVLGAHYAGALLARDLGDTGRDSDRRYAYVLTHDRDVVVRAAVSLLERVLVEERPTSAAPGRP